MRYNNIMSREIEKLININEAYINKVIDLEAENKSLKNKIKAYEESFEQLKQKMKVKQSRNAILLDMLLEEINNLIESKNKNNF